MGLFDWLRGGGSGRKIQGRIAAQLRKKIHDFDMSPTEGIMKLRWLCEEDPEMKRVPEGIERSFFCLLEAQIDVARDLNNPPDYLSVAGLWEANLV